MSVQSAEPDVAHVDYRAELAAERALLDGLARIAPLLAAELDSDALMQRLTDEATAILGARFGAFFYNVTRANGESYMLYTLSGVPREAFDRFGMPRNTAVFAPTFSGEAVVRSDDITQDPRYGHNLPHRGMPQGHLPVVSYLAVPVRSRAGAVLGGLFFGHEERAVFRERHERAALALSAIAGPLLDNATLFRKLKSSEAELAQANVRYRLVSEASQEGIWFWDIEQNVVDWNDALLTAMGIERAAWPGTFDAWFSRVHPEDQAAISQALQAHLQERKPYNIELFRALHGNGEYRWFTTVGQAEWNAEGQPTRMAGSVRDVTDRKLAGDALRQSEHRYAQILDSVSDLVFCKGADLRVTYANDATRQYQGKPLEERRSEADERAVFEHKKRVERLEEPHSAVDGSVHYLHTVKSPVLDELGNVVEVVAVSRDVTAQRRRQEMQRNLSAATAILGQSIDLDATLRNVADAIVPVSADWCAIDVWDNEVIRRVAVAHKDPAKVEWANELERRYPLSQESRHGAPAVMRSGKSEMMPEISRELLQQLARDAEHLRLIEALGLRGYITVPMLAHGRIWGALSIVSEARVFDQQDLEFAEELARRAGAALENALLFRQVRDAAATLEARVEERTSSLQEANEELQAFSYTVSHDLRAPIRHVSGFVDLLRLHSGETLDQKALHYLDTIKQSAGQMGALIDGLLAFSRLGRSDLNKSLVSLAEQVRLALQELEPDLAGRQIDFQVGELPQVLADATMLRLVLGNLLSNAVKYTRQRERAVIALGAEKRSQEHVIWVKDNGAGFDMRYASKLFGVFQRLHLDKEFEGTGIGLASARRIVTKHGGRIWAEAEPNRGAMFFFTLPHESPG